MQLLTTILAVLMCLQHVSSKSNNNNADFIKKQRDTLLSKGSQACSMKKFSQKSLDHFRLTAKEPSAALLCILEAMKGDSSMQTSGILWSTMGSLYQQLGQNTPSSTCFKQASKLSGKHTAFIKDWSFLGPFVIGKIEVDGDPTQAYGGIQNISKTRYKKGVKYYSEIISGGEIEWTQLKQQGPDAFLQVQPPVHWNELVSSLGSMGITEWQGWLVGEFAVNEKDVQLLTQCHGVHTVYIDDIPVTGDVYHRAQYWYAINLQPGLHTVYIRVRAKVQAQVLCKFKTSKSSYEVTEPNFLPDLFDGHLFSNYITFPVSNYHTSNFLKISKVVLTDLKSKTSELQNKLDVQLHDSSVSIAPGQIYPVVVRLKVKGGESQVISACSTPESSWDVQFNVKMTTSAGVYNLPIQLRCRSAKQSFLFTFLDHDGSVQHAAAIQPQDSCPMAVCPTVLSLHGTTITPQNQADSYKHMVDGEFLFGFSKAWTLAPTRHGAHNWEGVGLLTAMTALDALASMTTALDWIPNKAHNKHVVFAGHSMGGHGALHAATHYPDRALALVSLAAWIKKEEYGDSNLFFRHDIGASHVDPATKAVLESCIVENDADQHVSNLRGVAVVTRIGGVDRTVHPWFLRRMYRLLKEEGVSVNHTEVQNMEHWWWDTMYAEYAGDGFQLRFCIESDTNDGGAVNDQYLRDFTNGRIDSHLDGTQMEGSCERGTDCSVGSATVGRYTEEAVSFCLVCYNPALGEGVSGIRVLQQLVPYRKSTITGTTSGLTADLQTRNVARFSITDSPNRNIAWHKLNLNIDSIYQVTADTLSNLMEQKTPVEFCLQSSGWSICDGKVDTNRNRGPLTLGPARRIAEQPFKIIIGTQGNQKSQRYIERAAVYIANLFFLTANTRVDIVQDTDIAQHDIQSYNVIVIGNTSENLYTGQMLENMPIRVDNDGVSLERCRFTQPRTGVLSLVANGDTHLGLLLLGTSIEGLQDVVSLAAPTIPPMTRAPFSNLIPDYVITGPEYRRKGVGGYLCAGFYGNQWQFRSDASSCTCVY